jgi:hypothetical protein
MRTRLLIPTVLLLAWVATLSYAEPPTIARPAEGDSASTSVVVQGVAPGATDVNVWTDVHNAQTGQLLKSVPGLKHAVGDGGTFDVRVATPRVYFGEGTVLRYEINVRSFDGEKPIGDATVSLKPLPQPAAEAMQFPPGQGEAPIVTVPTAGEEVGPSVRVEGRTRPGMLCVVWTEVYNAETNELLRRVPGIRHLPEENGSFHFRVAVPRVYIGEKVSLRYEVHVKAQQEEGGYTPDTVVEVKYIYN